MVQSNGSQIKQLETPALFDDNRVYQETPRPSEADNNDVTNFNNLEHLQEDVMKNNNDNDDMEEEQIKRGSVDFMKKERRRISKSKSLNKG